MCSYGYSEYSFCSARVRVRVKYKSVFLYCMFLCKCVFCAYVFAAPKWATKEHIAVWVMSLSWLWLCAGVNYNGRKQSVGLPVCTASVTLRTQAAKHFPSPQCIYSKLPPSNYQISQPNILLSK